MKRIIYCLVMLLFLVTNCNVYADDYECTSQELERIKSLATLVDIHYEYTFVETLENDVVSRYPTFQLIANNLNEDLKVVVASSNQEFTSNVLEGFSEGERVVINIKAYTPNKCSGRTVLTKTIKLPYYNRYSENSECFIYPDFKYCSEFSESIINLDNYNIEFEKYLAELNNTSKLEDNGNWGIIYLLLGLISFMVLVFVSIILIKKIRRKNEL